MTHDTEHGSAEGPSLDSIETSATQQTEEDLPERRSLSFSNRARRWFFEGVRDTGKKAEHQDVWWKVMTLTGVDYFSSLGYAPGIAFLAAGMLSPIATIILVLLTLLGALPIYNKVAEESPHGQGSVSMLERLLPRWKGKLLVLVLLGFAATDFIITITLSAADAATHLIENPFFPPVLHNRMLVTVFMLLVLGAVFMKGFREAIGVCVWIVGVYLALNVVVVGAGCSQLAMHPEKFHDWTGRLFHEHGSIWTMVAVSCLLFPKLALGMSGFETGVAVMPHVQGRAGDNPDKPMGRIENARWLLRTAAIIMSLFLIGSSIITTLLIAEKEFQPGGTANGRALAYLAHGLVPAPFGSIYDLSTVLILWFAGASALAGLLNLVPRYLPRYGMAPNWTRAVRPLVVFFIAVGLAVTWWFNADVDAQGGAYATGVLVLMTSAALACTLVVWKTNPIRRFFYGLITLVFIYTAVTNMIERPDGLKIASIFILIILATSLISRAMRTTELRIKKVALDEPAEQFVMDDAQRNGAVRIVAHRPGGILYPKKELEARELHNLEGPFIFLEVSVADASEFTSDMLAVHGIKTSDGYRILRCESAAVPNTIAALLLHIRDKTHTTPHLYVGWTEGNPIVYIMKYLFFGEGETAPVTREILREAEHDPAKRPKVHVG
ncbi:MAG TPA: hypothetical protein V6D22_06730 [Candidatus Obscuribacterales bacterium]